MGGVAKMGPAPFGSPQQSSEIGQGRVGCRHVTDRLRTGIEKNPCARL